MTSLSAASIRVALASFALLTLVRVEARAQAWLPDKGETTVAISFQNIAVTKHYFSTDAFDFGRISSNTMLVDASYAATKRIALDFGLPYVSSKYDGAYPHDPTIVGSSQPAIDIGGSHGTLQDLRFAVRYGLVSGRVAVTPFVGTIVPSHDYPVYAHSAVGRRLRELSVGSFAAAVLDRVVPGAFVQGRYSYSFAQKILDLSHNRSNLDLEVGYFITPKLRAFALGAGQLTHGGVDLTFTSTFDQNGLELSRLNEAGDEVLFGPQYEFNHDRIDRSNYLNVGGGAAVSLTDSIDLFGSFVKAVAVRNGHAVNRGITIGLAWTVKPKGAPAKHRVAQRAERTLVRCICQKGTS